MILLVHQDNILLLTNHNVFPLTISSCTSTGAPFPGTKIRDLGHIYKQSNTFFEKGDGALFTDQPLIRKPTSDFGTFEMRTQQLNPLP